MKNIKHRNLALIFALAITIGLMGCGEKSEKKVTAGDSKETAGMKDQVYKVATTESIVEWLGKKVTGQHNGTIGIKSGEFGIDNGKVTSGKFEIDMKTIKVLDTPEGEASNGKLVGHLASDDFFAAEKFQLSKFEISKVEALNDPNKPGFNSNVTGNLTIRDVTKSITFPANIKIENNTLNATADFDIDRTEFGLKYGSGKFFEGLGDKMINDNFNLKLKIVAKP
jgi:polyisoprenoid-binding protein YceI